MNDGSRWIPRQLRNRMWHDGLTLTAAALVLAGALLLLQEPWQLSTVSAEEIVKLHGRQATAGALMNAAVSLGPVGCGLALIGMALLAYRASRI